MNDNNREISWVIGELEQSILYSDNERAARSGWTQVQNYCYYSRYPKRIGVELRWRSILQSCRSLAADQVFICAQLSSCTLRMRIE